MNNTTFELSGLTKAEFFDLESTLGEELVREAPAKVDSESYGVLDPVTATVIVTVCSLKVLATWLNQREEMIHVEQVDTTTKPDGTVTSSRRTVSYMRHESDAEVVKQLNAGMPHISA